MVEIEYEGVGIASTDVPYVFDSFYRGMNEKGEGHGLGLAGVRAIVEGHGEKVTVHSELQRGAVFNVFLPKSNVQK